MFVQMDHEWLQFDSGDKHDRQCMASLNSIWERRNQIECARHLDWELVESLNKDGQMQLGLAISTQTLKFGLFWVLNKKSAGHFGSSLIL